jgi:hypothetical protein
MSVRPVTLLLGASLANTFGLLCVLFVELPSLSLTHLAVAVNPSRLEFSASARLCARLVVNGLKETFLSAGGGEEYGLDPSSPGRSSESDGDA